MRARQALSQLSYGPKNMVGMTGFEPATFCSQNRRATKLRYIPVHNILPKALLLIKWKRNKKVITIIKHYKTEEIITIFILKSVIFTLISLNIYSLSLNIHEYYFLY